MLNQILYYKTEDVGKTSLLSPDTFLTSKILPNLSGFQEFGKVGRKNRIRIIPVDTNDSGDCDLKSPAFISA
jgi:hypothetical protein